jgi:hypothetical protein
MSGEDFKARVLAVHAKHTGSTTGHGALAWFGRWCGAQGRTGRAVYDWTVQEAVADGPHLTTLALLEELPRGSRLLSKVRANLNNMLPQ